MLEHTDTIRGNTKHYERQATRMKMCARYSLNLKRGLVQQWLIHRRPCFPVTGELKLRAAKGGSSWAAIEIGLRWYQTSDLGAFDHCQPDPSIARLGWLVQINTPR